MTEEQKEVLLLWGSLNQEQQDVIKFTMKNFHNEEESPGFSRGIPVLEGYQ